MYYFRLYYYIVITQWFETKFEMLNSNVVFVGIWQLVQTGYISVCQKNGELACTAGSRSACQWIQHRKWYTVGIALQKQCKVCYMQTM